MNKIKNKYRAYVNNTNMYCTKELLYFTLLPNFRNTMADKDFCLFYSIGKITFLCLSSYDDRQAFVKYYFISYKNIFLNYQFNFDSRMLYKTS